MGPHTDLFLLSDLVRFDAVFYVATAFKGCHEDAIRFVDTPAEGMVPHRVLGLRSTRESRAAPCESYDAIVAHLRKSFERPQHRYMARQALSACKQQTATTVQDPATQKERVLEEFVARLRRDIRYYVKLDGPSSFEQAVSKRQRNGGYSRDAQGGPAQPCYNCGGTGRFARQCIATEPAQPTARRDQSHDLLEAREQIRALSVSLRENQSALERSKARAHVLIKRNEELAQSQVSIASLVALSLCGSTMALPMSAWFSPDTFMRIPSSYNCSYIIPRLGDTPRPLSMYIAQIRNVTKHLHSFARS
ncbi:unnamed protein product [Haemonchus placei]|uniref:CCHC-type domain-containing protein n=1 Tax=Haemonchus placei TaxID=6290 RepID=A0A0N4WAE8_HAEPC|nr:unnamed protein product [Haemonchus placei]